MQAHKRDLIELMVRCDVLTFGDFTAKSGRKTPYFVNTGRYRTGAHISQLARFYAAAIRERLGTGFDVLFGPAYKGIPLVVATAMALYEDHGIEVGYSFNRKEEKDHGEKGRLLGHSFRDGDRVVILEDVITAGTSIRETVPLLQRAANVKLTGLVVSVDRMERGAGSKSALTEIAETYAMPAFSIVTVREVMEYLRERAIDGRVILNEALHTQMQDYLQQHGGT